MHYVKCSVQKRLTVALCLLGLRVCLGLKYLSFEGTEINELHRVSLSDNAFRLLPSMICDFKMITHLWIRANDLPMLPPSIASLELLQLLHVDQNELENLTPAIGSLSNLTSLSLAENKLTEIPPELGNCTSLTELFLSENSVCTFQTLILTFQ